jgi:hypothetical protein
VLPDPAQEIVLPAAVVAALVVTLTAVKSEVVKVKVHCRLAGAAVPESERSSATLPPAAPEPEPKLRVAVWAELDAGTKRRERIAKKIGRGR